MTVSDAFKEDVFAQETKEVFALLLVISHDDFDAPIYLTNDTVNIISNSIEYITYPFEFILPSDSKDSVPQSTLTIDNIYRDILESLRGLSSPPLVSAYLIRASAPDVIEKSYPNFYWEGINYNEFTISGTLVMDSLNERPFLAYDFLPSNSPGLF